MADTTQSRKSNVPEEFTFTIRLPHFVIEELKDLAEFHQTTLEEEISRAILVYHARYINELFNGLPK
ncbi:MAG: hypothetical protein NVSMB38_32050 [Ktedonobacteraceae bacterium]